MNVRCLRFVVLIVWWCRESTNVVPFMYFWGAGVTQIKHVSIITLRGGLWDFYVPPQQEHIVKVLTWLCVEIFFQKLWFNFYILVCLVLLWSYYWNARVPWTSKPMPIMGRPLADLCTSSAGLSDHTAIKLDCWRRALRRALWAYQCSYGRTSGNVPLECALVCSRSYKPLNISMQQCMGKCSRAWAFIFDINGCL